MRVPSEKTINLYNRLVANQNKVRKVLTRLHKQAEETSGAGRLPALIIPKSARKVRQNYFQGLSKEELKRRLKAFYAKLREAKRNFASGLKSYLARTLKDGYIELWRDQIQEFFGESPEGAFGKFTKEQIEESEGGLYMQVFNMLQQMSPSMLLALLYSGKIIQFKWIYQDMQSGLGGMKDSWTEQQLRILLPYASPKVRKEFYEKMESVNPAFKDIRQKYTSSSEEGEAWSYSGKHMTSTKKQAEKRYSRSRKKD